MDVEKLKKMNELSKELKRHGVASDTAEAFAKAGEIVRDESVNEVLLKSGVPEKPKDCFDSQYQIMLERQNRQMVQEICSIKEKISLMQEEKGKIIKYCEENNLQYTICPRYIRVNCDAISIEVKRIQSL